MKLYKIDHLVLFFFCSVYYAENLPWEGNDFSLQAQNMSLSSLLKLLAENYYTSTNIDSAIVQNFSSVILPGPPVNILCKLMSQYNLVSYYDGNMLFIYPAQRLSCHLVTLNVLSATRFAANLRRLNVPEDRSCVIYPVLNKHALEISGVPACLERVTQLATTLDADIGKCQDDAVSVVVYPLNYATALDDHYRYRDQTVVVPGIVSVLRDMTRGGAPAPASNMPATQGLPMFSADTRQNAVIVRDRSANMAGYRQLITQLDQRSEMIEISVTIIDVDAADISQLGIDWSAATSIGGGMLSFNNNGGSMDSGFSSVIKDTPNFMARLSALEKNSRTYVLSQPSVVTLNNIQAVLDKNVTFFTKLEGDRIAKLESVTTGSLLRVTPRLLEQNGKQNIMLNLNIQDGQQSEPISQGEPLPGVQNAEIASQAMLQAGQSLLLGGFEQDKQIQSEKKVPFLGTIPVLGHLFSTKTNRMHSVIRLFLINASVANRQQ